MRHTLIAAVVTAALVAPACLLAESREIEAAEVERDLVLEAKLTSEQSVMPGEAVTIEAFVINRSKTLSYPVVRPGDGSEAGWREPHVYYTATVNSGDGVWREVEQQGWGRCGLFDADWHDEVSTLAPGAKLELRDWLTPPHYFLDFQRAGRVRLVVHYRFTGGMLGKGRETFEGPPPGGLGGMEGVEAFELESKPIEFDVVRPVDVEVEVRGPVKAGTKVSVSDVLDARLVNREHAGFRVDAYSVSLLLKPGAVRLASREAVEPHARAEPTVLERGDYVRLLGDGFGGGRDERIAFGSAGEVEVAIQFTTNTGAPRLRSEWVKLTVTE